jgi:hypothetical protein
MSRVVSSDLTYQRIPSRDKYFVDLIIFTFCFVTEIFTYLHHIESFSWFICVVTFVSVAVSIVKHYPLNGHWILFLFAVPIIIQLPLALHYKIFAAHVPLLSIVYFLSGSLFLIKCCLDVATHVFRADIR